AAEAVADLQVAAPLAGGEQLAADDAESLLVGARALRPFRLRRRLLDRHGGQRRLAARVEAERPRIALDAGARSSPLPEHRLAGHLQPLGLDGLRGRGLRLCHREAP